MGIRLFLEFVDYCFNGLCRLWRRCRYNGVWRNGINYKIVG